MEGVLKNIAKDHLPGYEQANCVLGFGYIDREAGLTVEILSCGHFSEDNQYHFYKPNNQVRTHVRIAAVENIQFSILSEDAVPTKLYEDKLSVLDEYSAGDDIENTRSMTFLDASRDDYNIDDVLVHLIKPLHKVEACWVRIESLKANKIVGKLLNEPFQNLGIHKGELLDFHVEKNSNDRYLCCCYL